MASTAALQVQVHEAGGLQRRQAGTAFADLLSAMEALPEAFACYTCGSILAQSCLVVKVTRT